MFSFFGAAQSVGGATLPPLPALRLDQIGGNLTLPGDDGFALALADIGGGRLLLGYKSGLVLVLEDGAMREEPFLDLTEQTGGPGVRGLLGLTLHPDFATNGRLFVAFSDADDDLVVARFDSDGERAFPESEAMLLKIPEQRAEHTGGHLAFGPDGMLYVGVGDDGSGTVPPDPACVAQDDRSPLGKILRVDVDHGAESAPYFTVPADNPRLPRNSGPTIVWSKGLRHPWRFSFDRANGDLWIGDVGDHAREEIDLQPASSSGGENYGWKQMEGTLCKNDTAGCGFAVPACGAPELAPPILEYTHGTEGHCSVIGGYVYRGSRYPQLVGTYFFGDFCSGAIFAARRVGQEWQLEDTGLRAPGLVSLGEDQEGEIYALRFGRLLHLAVDAPTECVEDANTLCLQQDRFRVQARWRTEEGDSGPGAVLPLTSDTGAFWFFKKNNLEVVVKVLDVCGEPYRRFWVFAAGLTNVEVELLVTDTLTGTVYRHTNPLGMPFLTLTDTEAFATCDAEAP